MRSHCFIWEVTLVSIENLVVYFSHTRMALTLLGTIQINNHLYQPRQYILTAIPSQGSFLDLLNLPVDLVLVRLKRWVDCVDIKFMLCVNIINLLFWRPAVAGPGTCSGLLCLLAPPASCSCVQLYLDYRDTNTNTNTNNTNTNTNNTNQSSDSLLNIHCPPYRPSNYRGVEIS